MAKLFCTDCEDRFTDEPFMGVRCPMCGGGRWYPLNEDPSGQRREPMTPHPSDDELPFDAFDLGFKAAGGSIHPIGNTMEHIARDIRDGIFPKKSGDKKDVENG